MTALTQSPQVPTINPFVYVLQSSTRPTTPTHPYRGVGLWAGCTGSGESR
jgi:hypothetical protein